MIYGVIHYLFWLMLIKPRILNQQSGLLALFLFLIVAKDLARVVRQEIKKYMLE